MEPSAPPSPAVAARPSAHQGIVAGVASGRAREVAQPTNAGDRATCQSQSMIKDKARYKGCCGKSGKRNWQVAKQDEV